MTKKIVYINRQRAGDAETWDEAERVVTDFAERVFGDVVRWNNYVQRRALARELLDDVALHNCRKEEGVVTFNFLGDRKHG